MQQHVLWFGSGPQTTADDQQLDLHLSCLLAHETLFVGDVQFEPWFRQNSHTLMTLLKLQRLVG